MKGNVKGRAGGDGRIGKGEEEGKGERKKGME